MPDNHLISCIGCGAFVPDIDGATHKYLGASSGCWELYSEVLAREYSDMRFAKVHNLSVDTYAIQHPSTESLQTIQSAAVHLISLYTYFEKGFNESQLAKVKQKTAPIKHNFYWLTPPESLGDLTIIDIYNADADNYAEVVNMWAKSAWEAWHSHHHQIIEWATLINL